MKKLFCAFLSCVFLLTGCDMLFKPQETTAPVETQSGSQDTIPPESIPESWQLGMTSISLPLSTQELTTDDGTLLYRFTCQTVYPPLTQDADIAESVALDLMNRIDAITATSDSIARQAQDDYTGQQNWIPYSCQILYDPMRIDSGVVSLLGRTVTYTGSNHPDQSRIAVTYDLLSGKALTLGDILEDTATAGQMAGMINMVLSAREEDFSLYSDYAQLVTARFGTDWCQDTNWYFSADGLCFFFSPYEIAPYAAGTVVAEIPYRMLTGTMLDAYFPTEQLAVDKPVEAECFGLADLDAYTQIAEVILNREGEEYLLHTEGMLFQVRIEAGQWSADGTVFTPTATVFACASLTPGDAIMVQAALSETLPQLRLSYRCGDTEYAYFMTQSSDGSIRLIPQ
ncbi:MAG: DUF3298 domain-containing protein [Oscillospiraceae bacterium]|nr:DUF3298 domain-containing protein [Oscillospiraceae bacterium]